MKNLNLLSCLCIMAISFLSINNLSAQCIPAAPATVAGTVTASTGSFTFTGIATGQVIELAAPAAGVFYEISMCASTTAGNPDGTNDSFVTILDANSAAATSLGTGDDGCSLNVPNGWGPTVMSYTAAAAGSVFLYVTEYGADECTADGVNSSFAMTVTVTGAAPPCSAGVLTSPANQDVCPGGTFNLGMDGTAVANTFGFAWTNATTGGTGGTGGPIDVDFGLAATDFPFEIDEDILGVLSGNGLPVLEGTWQFAVSAYDATGTLCDMTAYTTVTFLPVTNVFVDLSATGANDGTSWVDAYTDLQTALATVNAADCSFDIVMAEGTYTAGPTRGEFFTINKDLRIFGGYSAGGATFDPALYPTILSGDIDGDGTLAGNTFHVLAANSGATGILVDLVIEGGNADNPNSFGRSRGGGVYISDAIVGMFRCTLQGNKAFKGGAVFSTLSETTLFDNCLVTLNEAENGSALYHSNETRMFIENTRIVDNNSTIRAAVEINNSLYTNIENSVIANNASLNANAIGFIATNRNQVCDIQNSTILGETKNKLLITMQIGFGDTLDVTMNNSIVAHQNANFTKNVKEFNNNVLNFTHNNCYFAGAGLPEVVSTGVNTLFSDVDGDLILNADYSLDPCSPGVNAGDDLLLAADDTLDIAGNPRLFGVVDLGAYEAQAICFGSRETNQDFTANTVDIYPNPANEVVNVRTDLENVTVTISDILGRAVIVSTNETTIDVSQLVKGTYILQVYQGDELMGTEKLMKN